MSIVVNGKSFSSYSDALEEYLSCSSSVCGSRSVGSATNGRDSERSTLPQVLFESSRVERTRIDLRNETRRLTRTQGSSSVPNPVYGLGLSTNAAEQRPIVADADVLTTTDDLCYCSAQFGMNFSDSCASVHREEFDSEDQLSSNTDQLICADRFGQAQLENNRDHQNDFSRSSEFRSGSTETLKRLLFKMQGIALETMDEDDDSTTREDF